MCKVFPSSLGLMAMRWFDALRPNSINSFKQLTQAFGSHFITSSRVPRPLDSLMFLSMREGETLKAYSDRYWDMYNEIESDYDGVAISTFKNGLPIEHGLKKSLTGKLVTSLRQLMDQIDKYKRVEEDQQLGKGKAKVVPGREGIFDQTDSTTIDQGETLQGNLGPPTRKQSTLCSETQYIRSLKR